jgi:putative ABC transport system permease protein
LRQVAISCLTHERTKFASALAGVTFATLLVLAQVGIYVGFLEGASAVIRHVGGDVWLMARGTPVVEFGEPVAAGTPTTVLSHPCVERVRPLVFAWVPMRRSTGEFDSLQVIGSEPRSGPLIPWSLREGLPGDLEPPLRGAVDESDLGKLGLPASPIGASLQVADKIIHIAAVTTGIRGFTLQPYMFTTIATARRLAGFAEGRSTYLVIDLKDPACARDVMALAERRPDIEARTTDDFAKITENYWITGSGAGAVLGFSALLGLVVGVVIVGQTLYSMTKDHQRELATLKAMGASNLELSSFVAWQAVLLAIVGGAIGTLLVFGLRRLLAGAGLRLVLSPAVLVLGYAVIVLMCSIASIGSVRKVLSFEAGEVFK